MASDDTGDGSRWPFLNQAAGGGARNGSEVMRAWLFQDSRQLQKLGEDKCPWSVGYYDPDGKKRSRKIGSRSMAHKFRQKVEGQLASGTYQQNSRKTWKAFREEYKDRVLSAMPTSSQEQVKAALDHFERIAKPAKMASIKASTIDGFVAKRRFERGKLPGSTLSPATVNKDLRHIKAALRYAYDWEYLQQVPRIRMLRVPSKIARYVTPEHFTVLYHDAAPLVRLPMNPGQNYEPVDWWRAIFTFGYMTGWRIDAMLSLRKEDLDLDAGTAISRHYDNKGKRDARTSLHPVVVEHLRPILGFSPLVFEWAHEESRLWIEFNRIQKEVGIHLPCPERHEHSPSCHTYGFHDLRRAFATMNADKLSADVLQTMMQHVAYQTTQVYINIARQMQTTAEKLHVPEALRKASG